MIAVFTNARILSFNDKSEFDQESHQSSLSLLVIFASSAEMGEIPRSLWSDRMSWAKWKPDHPEITG